MAIIFKPKDHQYLSIDEANIDWISVTTLIGRFKQEFDAPAQAVKSAKNPRSKWFGMKIPAILNAWKDESNRAIRQGSWYHDQQETNYSSLKNVERYGKLLPVVNPLYDLHGNKIAPTQKLHEGVYPEHFLYLKSAGVCGQSDLVEIADGKVHITDYKTNKEIKTSGFTNWEGITKKLKFPLSHMDDCNFNHYSIQLSMYLYIILKHNPYLSPGNIQLHHILFEELDETDKFGYPVAVLDNDGNPMVKEIVPYEIPYLRDEVIQIIHWLQDHRPLTNKRKTA